MSQTAEPIENLIRVDGVKTGKVTALDVPGQITQAQEAVIISETEAAMLRDYDRKVMELISVDDFDTAEIGAQSVPQGDAEAADAFPPGQVA